LILLYKAVFTRGFVKEFDKLPKTIKEQVIKGLEKAVEDPYAGTRLQGKLEGLWRWRIGKYRVIYTIDEKLKNIVFLDTGLRKSIYE
jgi:mRNA interferase RelE/StbE